jgi:hypothetical protein
VLGVALCVALLTACGGSDASSSDERAAATTSTPIPDLQDASCHDWRRADAEGRSLLLTRLEASRAQPVTGRGAEGAGTVLSETKASRMLDGLCSRASFQHLRLYRLYALAADFAGTAP